MVAMCHHLAAVALMTIWLLLLKQAKVLCLSYPILSSYQMSHTPWSPAPLSYNEGAEVVIKVCLQLIKICRTLHQPYFISWAAVQQCSMHTTPDSWFRVYTNEHGNTVHQLSIAIMLATAACCPRAVTGTATTLDQLRWLMGAIHRGHDLWASKLQFHLTVCSFHS